MTDLDTSKYTARDNPYLQVPALDDLESIDPFELLGNRQHLELEIGFGRGRFIRDRAMVVPHGAILGIETKRKLVYLCDQKAKTQGIDNLRVFHGDARLAVQKMPDQSFQNIFVNFPDPWWKARHQKRMVVTDALTRQVVRLLARGGHYFVQTDVDFRAADYAIVLRSQENLVPMGDGGQVDANPFGARSSRERRCEELGLPIYRLLFQKQ